MFRILLVENDPIHNFLTMSSLNKTDINFSMTIAQDGAMALHVISERKPLPDLILLDLYMPVLNGFEFLQEVKRIEHFSFSRTKVIVLTTNNDKIDTARALKLGAHSVLIKPLMPKKVYELLLHLATDSDHPVETSISK